MTKNRRRSVWALKRESYVELGAKEINWGCGVYSTCLWVKERIILVRYRKSNINEIKKEKYEWDKERVILVR